MALADKALGQAEAAGESSVGRTVGRFRVATSLVQPQTRRVDLVHMKKNLSPAQNIKRGEHIYKKGVTPR